MFNTLGASAQAKKSHAQAAAYCLRTRDAAVAPAPLFTRVILRWWWWYSIAPSSRRRRGCVVSRAFGRDDDDDVVDDGVDVVHKHSMHPINLARLMHYMRDARDNDDDDGTGTGDEYTANDINHLLCGFADGVVLVADLEDDGRWGGLAVSDIT